MEDKNLNLRVNKLIIENNKTKTSNFIEEYIPFIISTIASEKNGYVEIENNDEFSIALLAFSEAIKKYNHERGNFISFAKLVISSRLKNYWKKENKINDVSIDVVKENGSLIMEAFDETTDLKLELEEFENELLKFGINFEFLINNSPKHKDTRENAISISKKISLNKEVIDHLYEKKRLPLTKINREFHISIKVLKGNKIFITAITILFFKSFKLIKKWVQI